MKETDDHNQSEVAEAEIYVSPMAAEFSNQ